MRPIRAAAGRLHSWLFGSIRRRLTFFVMLVCILLLALVWALVVNLLEPMYNASIRADLERTMAGIVEVIEDMADDGEVVLVTHTTSSGDVFNQTLSEESIERLNDAVQDGRIPVSERSIDLSSRNGYYLSMIDTLYNSLLHPAINNSFETDRDVNGAFVRELRSVVLQNGQQYFAVLDTGQMVLGTTCLDGRIVVIVAGNVERISQALGVFNTLMLPIAVSLLVISMVAAWIFSRWFTSPLQRLSRASREMAKGNYNVRVAVEGGDEIATLATDFNTMAEEVKQASVMQRELIANVSHDLRTPLTLIKGYAETVRDLSGDDKPKRDEQLTVIVDEADRLGTLVGRVMELSRMSSGIEKPEHIVFSLTQLCDEVGYRYGEFCTQNGCNFDFVGEGACEIVGDPALLERALDNLLGNALNHVGEDGYVGLHVRPTGEGHARVEVIDHGPGIHPDDVPYIFDRYYRSRADAGKTGTGLGLSIAKAIFMAQSLDFGVESELGRGTTFWFEAPLTGPTAKK